MVYLPYVICHKMKENSLNESSKILKNTVPQIICYILKNMTYWENVDENL